MAAALAARAPGPDEVDEVVAFIATQQADSDRRIAYIGTEVTALRSELDGLEPAWLTTARVLRDEQDVAGVVVPEWDEELGRAWILGPWALDDGDEWMLAAGALLDAALATLPAAVTRYEMAGDVANSQLAGLARERGWTATEPSHLLTADASLAAGWALRPEWQRTAPVRPAEPGDLDAITSMHVAEFPDTYASPSQLVDGQQDGLRLTLVAETGASGAVVGYASGSIQEDGDGFIDFLVVDPASRRVGVGRDLTLVITRKLLERSPRRRVCLLVQDHRASARALYDALGFRAEGTVVAYRSWS